MSKPRSIHQRYQREFWPAMGAYVAIMFLLWPLLPRVHSELLRALLALSPVLPVLFVVRAMVRLVLGSDELEQRIHLIGLAIAATVVSTLSLAGGFLAAAGIIQLNGWILTLVWPALMVMYSAGCGWAGRRYGGDAGEVCNNGMAWHWQLLLLALVLVAIAWFGREQLDGARFGMLCGTSAGLGVCAVVSALLRWRKRQRGDHQAS